MSSFYGGGEEFLKRLLSCLEDDFNIILICSSALLREKLKTAKVKVELVQGQTFIRYVRTFLTILNISRNSRNTVLLNGQGAGYFAALVNPLFNRSVWVQHTSVKYSNSGLKLKAVLFCLKQVSTVICVSHFLKSEIEQLIKKKNIKVIHNWLPAAAVKLINYNPTHGKLKVLFIGRLVEAKGIMPLIQIILEAGDMELIILGDGPLFTSIQANYSSSPAIRLMGWQQDITSFIEEAHINVVNSYSEGFSYTPIETGVCGLPSLISDIEVHKEISEDGKYAFLFKAGSVEDLKAKLLNLNNKRDELASMSAVCRDYFIKEFVASNYKEAYKKELL